MSYHLLTASIEAVCIPAVKVHVVPKHTIAQWDSTTAAKLALWCWKMHLLWMKKKKTKETHMSPGLTFMGLVLLAKFGVWLCGLAQAFIFSICSHLRSKSCACLWEVFSFCLVMGALSRKTSSCFSSVQGHTHTHTQTPLARLLYWRLLIKSAAINIIVTSSTRNTLTIMFYFGRQLDYFMSLCYNFVVQFLNLFIFVMFVVF